jgi:hypothetical protein
MLVGFVAALAAAAPALAHADPAPAPAPKVQVGHTDRWYLNDDGSLSVTTMPSILDANGEHMDEVDFFNLVGRPDLADKVSSQRTKKWLLLGGGLVTMVGGGLWTAIGMSKCMSQPLVPGGALPDCGSNFTPMVLGGLIGGALVLGGAMTNTHPVSEDEMRDLAEQYNQQASAGTYVVPYASAGGGGVVLGGTF